MKPNSLKFRKIDRHLIDGYEVSAVQFWASWNGWGHHLAYDKKQVLSEQLDRGEEVALGAQTFRLVYEEEQ